ncbi:MAG TPA: hypothetical protein VMG58_11755 [Candidatus Sulfotelmatobacter sp.]|nr:hypothetical protein [Candidatus Sulfotelmatobacter sp.]
MLIEFTTNVQARMHDRDIAESDVRATLDAPDQLCPSFENRWRARKRIKDRALEVLFLRDPLQQQVITAYWVES